MFNFWRKNKPKENSIPVTAQSAPQPSKKLIIWLQRAISDPKIIYYGYEYSSLKPQNYFNRDTLWYETLEFKEYPPINIKEFVDKFLSKYAILKKCEYGTNHHVSYRIPDDIGYVKCKMGYWHNQLD